MGCTPHDASPSEASIGSKGRGTKALAFLLVLISTAAVVSVLVVIVSNDGGRYGERGVGFEAGGGDIYDDDDDGGKGSVLMQKQQAGWMKKLASGEETTWFTLLKDYHGERGELDAGPEDDSEPFLGEDGGDEDTGMTELNIPHLIAILPDRLARLINPTVDPCVDFHAFACGDWEERHAHLPDYASSVTFAFGRDTDHTLANVRKMLDPSAPGADTSNTPQKVLDYFAACNNQEFVDDLGVKPLEPYLSRIDAIQTKADLAAFVAFMHQLDFDIFFSHLVMTDHENPSVIQLYLRAGGLGLATPKFYFTKDSKEEVGKKVDLKADPEDNPHRIAYLRLMERVVELAGRSGPKEAAMVVWRIERHLAAAVGKRDEDGNIPASIRCDRDCLSTSYPSFDWDAYFAAWKTPSQFGAAGKEPFIVTRPLWMKAFNKVMDKIPLPILKTYIASKFLRSVSPLLPTKFLDALLEYEHANSGRIALLPRWKKCVYGTRAALPFLVSKAYVDKFIPAPTKRVATALVEDIRLAFKEEVKLSQWMSNATKREALHKLEMLEVEVGYPSDWRPYLETAVDINRGTYFDNYVRAATFKRMRDWSALYHPTNRRYWKHLPIVANAYYASGTNSAFLPVGMLQDPFYNLSMPAAYNFGAVGSIIGHELTHSLDKNGHRFDGFGRRRSWWDETTLHRYRKRSECFSDLYDTYELDGVHVNGFKTLGEDLADVGGAKTAYYAFLLAAELYSPHPPTPNDRRLFWLAYASTRCGVMRKKEEIEAIQTSVHPPHEFRLLGTVTQLEEFARDFKCPVGSPMNPAKKCELW